MIICSCTVVSDHEIRIAMATGAPPRTTGELFRHLDPSGDFVSPTPRRSGPPISGTQGDCGEGSSIDLTEHDIERAEDRRDIGKHVPAA